MDLSDITPLILTFNEEANIARVLDRVRWAPQVLVLDSGSTDRTRDIVAGYANVRFASRPFDSHTQQWNHALKSCGVDTGWVLALDADYVLSDELIAELKALAPAQETSGYRASFTYCIDGKPLWGSLYPPGVVLFRRERGEYVQDGHTQRLKLAGSVEDLRGRIFHDDRKPFSRWLAAQRRYMALEAAKLRSAGMAQLSWPDRVRKLVVVAPLATLLYCLFWKGCVLQGRAGFRYAFQRTVAELVLSSTLMRSR